MSDKEFKESVELFLKVYVFERGENEPSHPEEIKTNVNLQTEYGFDSLDMVELIMACEKEFEVSIPDDQCEGMYTINEFVTGIVKLKS